MNPNNILLIIMQSTPKTLWATAAAPLFVIMTVNMSNDFSVGMRVLAVDEDRVALKHLEALLNQCQYRAICTSEAITALKLLQDDKYKVDLVITDVDMPGIDGHKLLENVIGLNMDIPIIMLSTRSKELVMQGVTSGACEFLVKPVRIEELQNIWRHVVRRRNNLNPKELNNPYRPGEEFFETPKEFLRTEPYRKRKDQHNEEKKHEKQDLLTRKKRRVVWTQDLHHKFVAAVDKLGLEKAVPKRILELMNDENLTRENVASHLQKYRLFLKKSSQQANKVTSFGSVVDSAYDQNFSGFDNMQSMAGNMYISHSAPSSIGFSRPSMNENGRIYPSVEQSRVVVNPVAEFPCMSFSASSSNSDFYNPSNFRDLSRFQDDSLMSCVSTLPDIKSELHYQTHQFSHIVDHNMNHNMESVWNGLYSDFSNQLDQTLVFGQDLFGAGSAFPVIGENYGLVRDTDLDNNWLDHAELIASLRLEKQATNYSYNSDLVDTTKKGESGIEYTTT